MPTETLRLAEDLIAQHLVWGWRVQLSVLGFCGRCRKRGIDRVIELDVLYVRRHDEADVRDTILHEIAHALTPQNLKPHGPEWQRIAARIGAFPRKYGPASIAREHYQTPIIPRARFPKVKFGQRLSKIEIAKINQPKKGLNAWWIALGNSRHARSPYQESFDWECGQ